MKIQGFHATGMAFVVATLVAFSTANTFGQDTNAFGQDGMPIGTAAETPAAPIAPSATPLSSADMQIVELAQANVTDSAIINSIQNSGTVYGLDASQIVSLKQQGVSEAVINAMLNQTAAVPVVAQQQPQTPPPNGAQIAAANQQQNAAQPGTPPPSASSVFIVPDTQTYNYNNWASPYYVYPNYPYSSASVGVYQGWGWGGYHGGVRRW